MRRNALLLACLLTTVRAAAEPFVREDWVYVDDLAAPDKFGINHWGLESFPLLYRAVQRGKRAGESRWAGNYRFEGGRAARVGGGLLRGLSTMVEFGLFSGLQNFDHVLAHDSRGREFRRDYPHSVQYISWRFSATLPVFLGGKELASEEKGVNFQSGADARTMENSTIWEMRNQFVYHIERQTLARDAVNSAELANLIFHRLATIQPEWEEPIPACVAAYNVSNQPAVCRGGSGSARDFSNYIMDLNTGRYGFTNQDNYRLKVRDLKRANNQQLLDPIFLTALYRYGADYIVNARNTSRLPMIPLGGGLSYMPGFRIVLSPFGLEYIQDNFLRYRGTLTNLFWTRGDNRYERRVGAGFDVSGLPLWRDVSWGALGQIYKQPNVNRLDRTGPVTRSQFNVLHNVWNAALSLRAPIYAFGPAVDPKQVLLTLKVGRKNTGWMPGEYIKGSTYVDAGLGMRL